MVKLICPQCGGKVKRKYKTETIGIGYLGGVNCIFEYSCKEHGILANYNFNFVPDFENTWVDLMATSIKRRSLLGKMMIPIVIISPFLLLGLYLGDIAIGIIIFITSLLFGTILPLFLWATAMFDHKDDMAKIREFDRQFLGESTTEDIPLRISNKSESGWC